MGRPGRPVYAGEAARCSLASTVWGSLTSLQKRGYQILCRGPATPWQGKAGVLREEARRSETLVPHLNRS